jgi:hypothetical protein
MKTLINLLQTDVQGKMETARIGSLAEEAGFVMPSSAVQAAVSGAILRASSATWAFAY